MSKPTIEYRHNFPLDAQDVVRVFEASGITRPTKDVARIFLHACSRRRP
jgi:hypothetical protein